MATLYLHIGLPKTGTTAIQSFCEKNRQALAEKGCCYPELLNPKHVKNAHYMVLYSQDEEGNFASPEEERIWNAQMDSYQELFRTYPNVLLSEESLWWAAKFKCPGIWKRLKRDADARGFDVKIIVYLRRQDLFLTSWWAQHLKKGISMSMFTGNSWEDMFANLDKYVELDYYAGLERIASQFGREAVIARVYARNRFKNGDVVADFLQILGLRIEDGFEPLEGERNVSIGVGNALEIKRIINTLPKITPPLMAVARKATSVCYEWERQRGSYSMFSEEERVAFMENYAESNRLLARDYFGMEDGELFDALEKLPPKWTSDNPRMYESIVLFFGEVMAQQQEKIDRLEAQLREQAGFTGWLRSLKRGLKRRAKRLLARFKRR